MWYDAGIPEFVILWGRHVKKSATLVPTPLDGRFGPILGELGATFSFIDLRVGFEPTFSVWKTDILPAELTEEVEFASNRDDFYTYQYQCIHLHCPPAWLSLGKWKGTDPIPSSTTENPGCAETRSLLLSPKVEIVENMRIELI